MPADAGAIEEIPVETDDAWLQRIDHMDETAHRCADRQPWIYVSVTPDGHRPVLDLNPDAFAFCEIGAG
jgi:hypothetical protein